MKFNIFYVIGKKNNQIFVIKADQEILTLGPTDIARNLVNLIWHDPFYTRVGISRYASVTDGRVYLDL